MLAPKRNFNSEDFAIPLILRNISEKKHSPFTFLLFLLKFQKNSNI